MTQPFPAFPPRSRQRFFRSAGWIRASLPLTLVFGGVYLTGLAVVLLLPLPGRMDEAMASVLGMLPLVIALNWAIRIPKFWDVEGNWIALGVFAGAAMLALVGRWFAAVTLNDLFHDNPTAFPIAQIGATYAGTALAALALFLIAGMVLLLLATTLGILAIAMSWPGWRRTIRYGVLMTGLAVLLGAIAAAWSPLTQLARDGVMSLALSGDFFPRHRCLGQGWPKGIDRVAFIGDQQVMAYRADTRELMILPCTRPAAPARLPNPPRQATPQP